jgi:hypothetical protein
MQETRLAALSIFKEIMMNKVENMDSKMLNYWIKAINSGQKTEDDFRTFLLKSQDYQNVLRHTFSEIYYDKLSDKNYQNTFDKFLEKHSEKNITEKDIVDFITASPEYVEKYTKIIKDIFELINGELPSVDEITVHLHKFQSNPHYSIDDLREDISNKTSITFQDADLYHDFSDDQQKEIISLWNDKTLFLDFYRRVLSENTDHKNVDFADKGDSIVNNSRSKSDVLDVVKMFEETYGRNMNVREYLLYIDDLLSQKVSDRLGFINKLKKRHYELLINVRDIVNKYLNKDLGEDEFIERYLDDTNKDSFLTELEVSIINSEDYEVQMSNRLTTLYKNLYDVYLTNADTQYLFKRVKQHKYDLQNEELNNVIVEFKNETDNITERIFRIFMDTYQREPDVYEINRYVQVYRNNNERLEDTDKVIEAELHDSLEYHDVIKNKIKKAYGIIKNENILPSILYNLLEKVLKSKITSTIDDLIDQIISE